MVSCRLGRLKCFVVKCRHGGSRVDYGHISFIHRTRTWERRYKYDRSDSCKIFTSVRDLFV